MKVICLTGMDGAGKSTLAHNIVLELRAMDFGLLTCMAGRFRCSPGWRWLPAGCYF